MQDLISCYSRTQGNVMYPPGTILKLHSTNLTFFPTLVFAKLDIADDHIEWSEILLFLRSKPIFLAEYLAALFIPFIIPTGEFLYQPLY